ncbi:PHA/PHB synthase family protein [Mangrovicoccus ximenensis]|uniref:PHA/PHB synthase family protein n=1 Tax=Mangrovicoccus ximenensis TaxID=1911570 RepID=UPI000D375AEF|nr:class I poly(R)-hydroxyalkanoic acid synthase [Mangrovicoccus ximenensis]
MTTDEKDNAANLDRLNNNIARMEELSQRLVRAMASKRAIDPNLQAPDRDVFVKAMTAYMSEMMNNPAKIIEHQVSYWGKMLKHYVEAQHLLTTGKIGVPSDPTPKDPRFQNPLWDSHPYFNFLKQNYLLTSDAISQAINGLEGLDGVDRKKIEYFTQQIINMMSPTNFLGTNPEALERAVTTEGESLVKGLENLVRDIEANNGEVLVSLADSDAFKVGGNIATSEGAVVYRNRMFELIQYAPKTEQVHKTPIVLFPPWINKFYILDLKPKNSLVKWIVEQGYTLFVVSWINPDKSYADVSLDDYVEEGYLTAIEQVKAITGEPKVNAIGYCIAGTTLSLTLALMEKRKDKSVNAATFFTTMTDFEDPGEIGVFLGDDFVDAIEREVSKQGILDKFFMTKTFSFLRSNDLVYGPAIKSYMLGDTPPAFDLLYWNGDGTNLPGKMAVQYLRQLCQHNEFCDGGFEICGEKVQPSDIKLPVCSIACETDHIAIAKGCYSGFSKFGSRSKTFILSQSGHIAGIVNPPSKGKYGHYTNPDLKLDFQEWKEKAEFTPGTWWFRWEEWLRKKSGAKVPARPVGNVSHPALAPAPGTYVVKKPEAA